MKKKVNSVSRPAVGGSVKWLCAALCLAAGFGLSACSDDDEGGEGGGAVSGVAAQQMPLVADAGIQFPVTQQCPEGLYWEMQTYTYADGRMTGGNNFTISTNPLELTNDGDVLIRDIDVLRNIKVNGDGFIVYADIYDEDDNGTMAKWASCHFEYDADGHLVREHGTWDESLDNSTYQYTCTYTWENGNLVKAKYSDRRNSDGDTYTYTCTFTYDADRWLNPGIYPPTFIDASFMDDWPFLFYSGLLGRTTRNIPATFTEENSEEGSCSYTTTAINTNQDGSIASWVLNGIRQYYDENDDLYLEPYEFSTTYLYGYADYPISQEESYYAAPSVKGGQSAKSPKKARRMMRR